MEALRDAEWGGPRNPYPVFGDGAGVGVGSASEDGPGGKPCCGGCAGGARCEEPVPLVTGSAIEGREASRADAFGEPHARPASVPAAPQAARPSPFALPPGGCDDASCEGSVRARDFMVHFVRTGATWPALRPPGS